MPRKRFPKRYRPPTLKSLRQPMPNQRNGGSRKWAALSKQVAREEPICWLQFPGCTVRSTGADHYHTVKTHPHLEFVRSNLRGACHHCNVTRRDTPPHLIENLRAELIRKYKPPPAWGVFG